MSRLSPSEKKGLIVIGGIFLIGFFIQWIQPHFTNTGLYDYSVQDSIFIARSADSVKIELLQKTTPKKKTKNTKKNSLKNLHIDINKAGQKELEKLPRIGPVTAQNIILFREENGPFKNIKEIQKVKRIGPKTFDLIKPFIFIKDSL